MDEGLEERYSRRFAATKWESDLKLDPQQHFESARYAVSSATEERRPDCLRVVCISDTHNRHRELDLPEGDVLVHTGDMTLGGSEKELVDFARWFAEVPGFERKICIAGNHDLALDVERRLVLNNEGDGPKRRFLEALGDDATYLEDSSTTVRGLRFFGTPWQPYFEDWAFQLGRGTPCRQKWRQVPDDVDVLLTHGPPLGRGDRCVGGNRAGCEDLLDEVQTRIKPLVCVFGHIHEAAGSPSSDGHTDYVNAASCTLFYRPDNPPVLLDLPLPSSATASS